MIYTIKEGKHRATPYRFGIWRNKRRSDFIVMFTESCRYDLGNSNQDDLNKLFGIGFVKDPLRALFIALKSKFGGGIYKAEHHKESVRIGWRYNKEKDVIEIHSYCYVNSQRKTQWLADCKINREYDLRIDVQPLAYWITFADGFNGGYNEVPYFHSKKWSYPLEIYFGGDETAPHTMKIEMK